MTRIINPSMAPRRVHAVNSDVDALFGDDLIVHTTDNDVSINLPSPSLGQPTISIVKNDASDNVVWLIGTVNGQVDRSIFNANEALELRPTNSGYVIV